ncbi:MAG: redox-sensing transcriptional repressor Rex [Clostridia bacterium]
MPKKEISEAVIKRLPRYYRQLKHLQEQGIEKISSTKLAENLNLTASQVRQDFCNFGGFGQQGYGYDVAKLKNELAVILGLDKNFNLIIVGAGNMGRALAGYKGFDSDGFVISALFDVVTPVESINNIPLYNMDSLEDYLKNNNIDIAIITVQKQVAKQVARELVDCGIKSIWNFAPVDLDLPKGVVVENISLKESLFVLSYRSKNIHNQDEQNID